MEHDLVFVERDGLIGIITIDNPDKQNAVSNEMLEVMDHALHQMEEEQVRSIIIKGAGDRVFCSGYDVTGFQHALSELEADEENRESGHYLRITLRTIESIGVPVIAMINGHCIGAGVDISAACDFRYAASGVKIGVPPSKMGIIYNPDGIRRLINLVGVAKAKELFFLGNNISSEEAYALGFLNKVVPSEELEKATISVAHNLAEYAPLSLRGMKRIFGYYLEHQELSSERESDCRELIIEAMKSDDASEALAAFTEKRKPVFEGR